MLWMLDIFNATSRNYRYRNRTCETLNRESDRARMVLLPKPLPTDKETHRRIKNNYEVQSHVRVYFVEGAYTLR